MSKATITWQDRASGTLLHSWARMTSRLSKYQVTGLEHLRAAQERERPLIFAAWHGMTMMLVGFFANHYDLSRLVLILPDDWRGTTLVVFANKLGVTPFPMNLHGDASMATARQLAKLVRQVKAGRDAYITPDGPDGPSYEIKPGITYIAQKADATILPLGAYARRGYRVPRWDRYVMPYPFSKIAIQIGEPLVVGKNDEGTAVTSHLANQLHHVTLQAAANFYEKPFP
ncbi:lysophospholipid acyltransferase family protein [Candidatus Leptofilum sp.]|uniref:lysophospholipid acyltransferase family protein n=1 Tax=Candidatus Leptofilum sp. TaxID=3241576 RepID=UPI003B5BDD42